MTDEIRPADVVETAQPSDAILAWAERARSHLGPALAAARRLEDELRLHEPATRRRS
jgi:hypothetical protein